MNTVDTTHLILMTHLITESCDPNIGVKDVKVPSKRQNWSTETRAHAVNLLRDGATPGASVGRSGPLLRRVQARLSDGSVVDVLPEFVASAWDEWLAYDRMHPRDDYHSTRERDARIAAGLALDAAQESGDSVAVAAAEEAYETACRAEEAAMDRAAGSAEIVPAQVPVAEVAPVPVVATPPALPAPDTIHTGAVASLTIHSHHSDAGSVVERVRLKKYGTPWTMVVKRVGRALADAGATPGARGSDRYRITCVVASYGHGSPFDVTDRFLADAWYGWLGYDRSSARHDPTYLARCGVASTPERDARIAASKSTYEKLAALSDLYDGDERDRAEAPYRAEHEAACAAEEAAMARAAAMPPPELRRTSPVSSDALDSAQAASAVAAALVADDPADQDAVAYLREADATVVRLTPPAADHGAALDRARAARDAAEAEEAAALAGYVASRDSRLSAQAELDDLLASSTLEDARYAAD